MDGKTVLFDIRQQGFTIELDPSGKPTIEPRNRLTLEQREMLKTHKDDIKKALEEEKRCVDPLTPWDQPGFDELAAWWLAWTPPKESYELESGVMVVDPVKSYEYHAAMAREERECVGQVKLAMYWWMKKHWLKFAVKQKVKMETKSS